MSYKYIYDPVALAEYKEAIAWYIEKSEQASINFIEQVKQKLEAICNGPQLHANYYKSFRETSLKKYPYIIVYYIDEPKKMIVITSVYHHKRNPKRKYKK